MTPLMPTPTEEVWGDKRFVPSRFDPQEAEPWIRYVWAKFLDSKPVSFQPKDGIHVPTAIKHLKACMNTEEVAGGRRLMAAAWLCGQWFEDAAVLS